MKSYIPPEFLIDSYPDINGTYRIEKLREISVEADPEFIFPWLSQFRVAPYSYDYLDHGSKESPEFIVQNLPPIRHKDHLLLAFNVDAFEENKYIVARFCEPIITPYHKSVKELLLEYRIEAKENESILWCKVKGQVGKKLSARIFYWFFLAINNFMTKMQLKRVKHLSEQHAAGKIKTGNYPLENCCPKSGIYWYIFCRRKNCPAQNLSTQ